MGDVEFIRAYSKALRFGGVGVAAWGGVLSCGLADLEVAEADRGAERAPKQASACESGGKPPHSKMSSAGGVGAPALRSQWGAIQLLKLTWQQRKRNMAENSFGRIARLPLLSPGTLAQRIRRHAASATDSFAD
jgi:hypothetical protein